MPGVFTSAVGVPRTPGERGGLQSPHRAESTVRHPGHRSPVTSSPVTGSPVTGYRSPSHRSLRYRVTSHRVVQRTPPTPTFCPSPTVTQSSHSHSHRPHVISVIFTVMCGAVVGPVTNVWCRVVLDSFIRTDSTLTYMTIQVNQLRLNSNPKFANLTQLRLNSKPKFTNLTQL